MKKIRLLALTTSYPLYPESSAGLFIRNLYRQMTARCSVEVVCPAEVAVPRTEDDAHAGITVHAVRYAPRAWRTLAQVPGGVVSSLHRAPWRIMLLPVLLVSLFWRCLLRAGSADLIHANWAVCGVVAGIVGKLRKKPVVTTLRGSDVRRAAQSRLERTILGLAINYSRVVICVSEAMAEQVRKEFPHRADDIHVCLNGVDEAFFQHRKVTSDATALNVLAVGNLIRVKGFDVLIEAVARARMRDRIHVCIIGEGPWRATLLSMAASKGVSDRFRFVGPVPATEMPKRYAEADVFVLSSRSEGRPNVVVEALAGGLPVISTDLDGVQGMVADGDTGWLVAVDDAEGLATALDEAVADRVELHRRGSRAREFAQLRIGTWRDTARCYEALFQHALTTSSGQHPSCAE